MWDDFGMMLSTSMGKSTRIALISQSIKNHCLGIATGEKSLYLWNDLYYKSIAIETFAAMIGEIFQIMQWMDYKSSDGRECYNQVRDFFFLPIEKRMLINNYETLVPFLNGYYNRVTQELIEPDPTFYFTAVINVSLADNSHCPEFRAFFNQIVPDYRSRMEILCYFNYCMSPSIKRKMLQIWVGNAGDNGKSELGNILYYLMPDFISNIPLSTMMNDRKNQFVMAEMAFTWLNLASEINPNALSAEGVEFLKQLTGELYIRAEKKHETGYKIQPKAKQLVIANEMPLPKAYCDNAFWNRIQMIEFNQVIPLEDQEEGIIERIFMAEGGQIARMILSVEDHMDQYLRKDPKRAEEIWNRNTQSVFVFYNLHCEDGQQKCDELFDDYLVFCDTYRKRKESLTTFTRLLKSMGVQKLRAWDEKEKEQYYYYTCQAIDEVPNHINQDGSLNVEYILGNIEEN